MRGRLRMYLGIIAIAAMIEVLVLTSPAFRLMIVSAWIYLVTPNDQVVYWFFALLVVTAIVMIVKLQIEEDFKRHEGR